MSLIEAVLYAASMTAVMLYVVYEVKMRRRVRRVLIAVYIAGMMLTMNLGLYLYLLGMPTIALTINSAYMFLALVPLTKRRTAEPSYVIPLTASLVIASEVAMGAFLNAWTGSPSTLISAIQSPWFLGVMIPEMFFSAFLSMRNSDRLFPMLLAGALTMSFFPPTFPEAYWSYLVWASAIAMIGSTVLIYDSLYRDRLRATQETLTSMEIMLVFTAMMASTFTYYLTSLWSPLDVVTAVSMGWLVYRALAGPGKWRTNYLRDSRWTFTFLTLTFVMEWFMGGTLDFLNGLFAPGVAGFTSSLPLGWLNSYTPTSVLWDFLSAVTGVTGSIWFLIMMGVEMGFLAFRRALERRVRENRIRMGLMIGAYALYTIYFPGFSPLSSKLASIPYMWSMGVGTLGPVTLSVIPALLGTYAVSGVLSFLFGSRQLCSVTCTAPMMYQGTFYNSLKVYNRSSRLGRKTLTSRLSPWFKVVVVTVSTGVLGIALISYLNSIGAVNFTVLGIDVSAFVYTVWFNLLWYLVFISIPFMGTYACVTGGWCYWGTFNQLVSRMGLFRLKVKDPETCLRCPTVDCAKACPVGLTDMRSWFLKQGEFKSMKCIGVGECVDACPYDNIYFYDVRNWIRERLKRL